MDLAGPILNIATCLWDRSEKHTVYICHLEENLDSLRDKMKDLKNRSEDVKRRVELEEEQQMRRTNLVNGWLQSVEAMEKEVKEILQSGAQEIQKKCLGGCCPKNCRSIYKLGKIVTKKLNAVTQLMDKGRFDVFADRLPRANVEEKPMGKTVGLDSTFEKVWRCIRDDNVGIIGLYGMGGVGKTTLLKKINNELLNISHDFDVVIWAGVSKDANAEKVQDAILKKLVPSDHMPTTASDQDDKATQIFRLLSGKRFLLLLDDLWKGFDLVEVGVPAPDNKNKSKVVFTTRSEDVCGRMGAQKKIKVECLPPKKAWELFQMKLGEETLNMHPNIPKLAMFAAEQCGGLPVALITIGRAMASRKTPQEWERALEVLKNAPSKFSGMGDGVFPLLKFSYDSLLNDTVRSCFIYCSLHHDVLPSDKWTERLVELWMGEGFLDEFDDINEARNKGYDIIESLKHACLLESYDLTLEECLGMHDVIRDMALWVACECGRKMGKFVVREGDELIEAHEILKWKKAERIFLTGDAIEKLNVTLRCPNLLTLFVRRSNLKTFPSGLFQFMPVLRVLDLSDNLYLIELPVEISRLVSLQYLDLSNTMIRELPIWFKNLVNLKFLRWRSRSLVIIPKQVISSLSMLQVLDMTNHWPTNRKMDGNVDRNVYGNEALLAELERLEHLKDMRINLKSVTAFQVLLSSPKLRSCTFGLNLVFCKGLTSLPLSSLKDMKNLETLLIDNCVDLNSTDWVGVGYFNNLTWVRLENCQIPDLTWLISIPTLQKLHIGSCNSVEEVIRDNDHGGGIAEFEESSSIFSRLKVLFLYQLPELKSIYRHALPFPSLTHVIVFSCPKLKKLPFDPNSANSLKMIRAYKQWWNGLEWDDEATLRRFLLCLELF